MCVTLNSQILNRLTSSGWHDLKPAKFVEQFIPHSEDEALKKFEDETAEDDEAEDACVPISQESKKQTRQSSIAV